MMCKMDNNRKQEKIVIKDNALRYTVPGMLQSVVVLSESSASEDGDINPFFRGRTLSAAMIVCHCIELLLKYKIQLENKKIEKGHNLYNLFNTLTSKSKSDIEYLFDEIKPEIIACKDLDSVEAILKEYQDVFTDWRYFMTIDKPLGTLHIAPLYNVAMCIYKSTPIYTNTLAFHRVSK